MILVAKAINRFSIFLIFIILFLCSCDRPHLNEYALSGETMGTTYRIVINSKDSIDINLQSQIDSILLSFNQSMSTYIDNSEISVFNKMDKGEYLNVSNDLVVDLFLNEKISFVQIPDIIKDCMNNHSFIDSPTLSDILSLTKWTENYINSKYLT